MVNPCSLSLTRLPLTAIPDVFERAIGYRGDARYLLLYWEPAGDELMWSDGQRTTCGEWQSYLLFIQHPRIAWAVAGFDFGGSDAPAHDGLVLDRQERALYAGSIREARRFVQEQHGPRLTLEAWATREGITVDEARARQQEAVAAWLQAIHAAQAERRADPAGHQADVAERMRIAEANFQLLQAALDALPPPALLAPLRGMTMHRITCVLCQRHLGEMLTPVATLADTIQHHLADAHHLDDAPETESAWQHETAGTLRYQPAGHTWVILEPPHRWLTGEVVGRDALDTMYLHQMVFICCQQFPGVFDTLALGLWCGMRPDALVRHVQHVTGLVAAPSLRLVAATLDYLTRMYRHHEQGGGESLVDA